MIRRKITYQKMKLLSSLAKGIQDEELGNYTRWNVRRLSVFGVKTVSFQAASTGDFFMRERLDVDK